MGLANSAVSVGREDDHGQNGIHTGLSIVGAAYFERLSQIAAGCDKRIHAVVDGARFAALTSRLSVAGLCHRPLYRQVGQGEGENQAVVLGGPWLVSLSTAPPRPVSTDLVSEDDVASDEALAALSERLAAEMADAIARGDESGGGMLPSDGIDQPEEVTQRIKVLLELVGDRPGVVFWISERSSSDDEVFRHLRGINRILVPQEWATAAHVLGDAQSDGGFAEMARAAGVQDGAEDATTDGKARFEPQQAVVFRHADPNVMMQVFPRLSPEQAVRLMGPAEQIFFAPDIEWGGGVKRGRRPQDVVAEKGMLFIRAEQMAELHDVRATNSQRKIADYLRKVAPKQTADMSDAELDAFVQDSCHSGRELGLRAERAQGYWAYLLLYSGGRMGRDAAMRDMLLNHPELGTPDQIIYLLMRRLASLPDRH